MSRLELVTGPASEPLTLAEARLHLRLDATGSPPSHPDDSLVTNLLKAARQYLDGRDGMLHRALITQTWRLYLDEFPADEIRIPLPPLQGIVSVKYDDANGSEQTLPTADYVIDLRSSVGWILPASGKSWPATFDSVNAVRVEFNCGYGAAASNLPEPIRSALLLMLGFLYENRGSVDGGMMPAAAYALLSPFEVVTFP